MQDWKPDLFAPKFVPSRLLRINEFPATPIVSPYPPYVDFEEYAQSFLPEPLYKTCPSTVFLAAFRTPKYALDINTHGPQVPLSQIDFKSYSAHFRNTLIEERRALAEEFKQCALYEVQLEPVRKEGMFQISVPGLRDYIIPPVFHGDSLIIRSIRHVYGQPNGYFDGYEYHAHIWNVDRRKVCPPSRD
jgi:hypothetical protein